MRIMQDVILIIWPYLFFRDCPGHRFWVTKAHTTKDGYGHPQATVTEPSIFAFRIFNGLLQPSGDVQRHVSFLRFLSSQGGSDIQGR
jgi:hypothetical protein